MDVRSEILDYINQNETTGALLITGKWGCGKSFLVKAIAEEQDKSKEAAIAIISLFGLDSIAAINRRVKEEYIKFSLGLIGKIPSKVSRTLTGLVKNGMAVASIAADGNAALAATSHGISTMVDVDALGFFDVKSSVGKGDKARRFVIVFDDLERSNIEKRDLLGTINEFVENRQIKVIIIADEERINEEAYREYKEKLITRTIRLTPDYEQLIDRIIDSYQETTEGYKAFLKGSNALLKQVFTESKSDNLRILKAAIADFERVYEAWRKSGIDTSDMRWALYTFVAKVYISRMPIKDDDRDEKEEKTKYLYFDNKEKQYKLKGINKSDFSAFDSWIHNGVWNEKTFIDELRIKYNKEEPTPLNHFLQCRFWDLQQEDIDAGLPIAIQLAYEGRLSRDELITTLKYVHYLKINSIDLPCEIEYKKIEAGFIKHLDMMKRNEINDPARYTFTDNNQIDAEAYSINKLIERSEDIMDAWNNRVQFIEFLRKKQEDPNCHIQNLCIEEFDDELLEIFEEQYSFANNANKRQFALALLGMSFEIDSYSTTDNVTRSKQNFERLIEWLNSQHSQDAITSLINRSLIREIQESSIMRKTQ